MSKKIIQVLGFLLIAVFVTPFVTSAAIGVTWQATSTTPGYITPTLINGYAPGIGVTNDSYLNMGTNAMTGFGTTSPYANVSIHANNGETNQTLFAIGSSTQTSTSTLFTIDNTGTVHVKGGGSAYTNIGQFTGAGSFSGIGFGTTPGVVNATGYSMIGDGSNTYLNAPTSGSMYFRQGNQERMFLNSSGNFGIGTTSPLAKLSIQANAGENNPYLFAIGSSTGAYATTTLFSVNNVGSVSIGTSSVPANTLTFQGFGTGMAAISLASSISGPIIKTLSGSNNSTLYLSPANGLTRLFDIKNGTLAESLDMWNGSTRTINLASNGASYFNGGFFGIGSTTPYANLGINANNGSTNTTLFAIGSSTQTATTTLFTVTNTGNVGIGVAAPSTQLQVAANSTSGEMTPVILQNISNANGAATSLGFSQNATLTGPLTGKLSSIRNNAASFDMALYSSTGAGTVTEGLRLTSARNLGVGSTSPQSKLVVHANNGDTNTQLFTVASSTQTATTTLYAVDNVGHEYTGGATPTLSAGTFFNSADDSTGTITTVSGAGTTFTLTFAAPWKTAPACTANFATTTSAIAIDTTTTAAVFTYPSVNNVKLHYQCRNSF